MGLFVGAVFVSDFETRCYHVFCFLSFNFCLHFPFGVIFPLKCYCCSVSAGETDCCRFRLALLQNPSLHCWYPLYVWLLSVSSCTEESISFPSRECGRCILQSRYDISARRRVDPFPFASFYLGEQMPGLLCFACSASSDDCSALLNLSLWLLQVNSLRAVRNMCHHLRKAEQKCPCCERRATERDWGGWWW